MSDASPADSESSPSADQSPHVSAEELARLWTAWQPFLAAGGGNLPPELERAFLDLTREPRLRQRWIQVVTRGLDAHLRSPAFLQLMRGNLQRWIAWSNAARHALRDEEPEAHASVVAPPWLAATHPSPGGESSSSRTGFRTTPHEVAFARGPHRLLRFRSPDPVRFAEPLLICYALVNRPYILDLKPGKSVVEKLLARGFDVYLIDWGVPTLEDRELGVDHYVGQVMGGFVSDLLQRSTALRIHLTGYCMGGTLSAIYATRHPEQLQTLTLLTTPIDFHAGNGLLKLWADASVFDVDAFLAAFGNCPGYFLQSAFQVMRPVQNFIEKYLSFVEAQGDVAFLDNFIALERWANDHVPVAGRLFRQFVVEFYQRNALVQGEFVFENAAVRLQAISSPLLLLTADRDHLVPPASSLALRSMVASRDVESYAVDAGHIGLAVSGAAHRHLWPAALEWLASRSTPAT